MRLHNIERVRGSQVGVDRDGRACGPSTQNSTNGPVQLAGRDPAGSRSTTITSTSYETNVLPHLPRRQKTAAKRAETGTSTKVPRHPFGPFNDYPIVPESSRLRGVGVLSQCTTGQARFPKARRVTHLAAWTLQYIVRQASPLEAIDLSVCLSESLTVITSRSSLGLFTLLIHTKTSHQTKYSHTVSLCLLQKRENALYDYVVNVLDHISHACFTVSCQCLCPMIMPHAHVSHLEFTAMRSAKDLEPYAIRKPCPISVQMILHLRHMLCSQSYQQRCRCCCCHRRNHSFESCNHCRILS